MKISDILCYRCRKPIWPYMNANTPKAEKAKMMCTRCTLLSIKEALEVKRNEDSVPM